MPFITIEGLIPEDLNPFDTYQTYNLLDCAVTAQLAPAIRNQMNENQRKTYLRELNVSALCLEMSSKGFPVNQFSIAQLDYDLEKDQNRAQSILNQFCDAVGYSHINPRSTTQVPHFFYEFLGLPAVKVYDRSTQTYKVSTDAKALEKLQQNYPFCSPFVNAILAVREPSKMRSVFKRGLEPPHGNLRCNFNLGTETGRLASQQNIYGGGTNAQNLTDRVRQVVEAPDGYAILNLDLKTAESFAVGYISRCQAYIDACKSGDLHTMVSRMNWPGLAWTGDLKLDRAIAETVFYRWFTHRDMAKKGGHGTNYYGTPNTMAGHMKIPAKVVAEFQRGYFEAFPEIPLWHLEVIARIQTDGRIVNAMGRERRFWGRSDDPATHREAIAFDPQSIIADVMNDGLVNVQRWIVANLRGSTAWIGRRGNMIPIGAGVPDLRAQVHDAGVFIVPIEALDEVAPIIQKLMLVPVDYGDMGVMEVPSDISVGKVWCKHKPKGQARFGLKDWVPGQELHWDTSSV